MLLCDLLAKGQQAIAATSTLIGLGMLPQKLDATGVSSLEQEELKALFSAISVEFELEQIFIVETLSDRLREQVTDYIQQRQGKKIIKKPVKTVRESSTTYHTETEAKIPADIFSLRDEVINDYRSYIESFLKIKDSRVSNRSGGDEIW
jgi:hypothetical protein